VNQLRRPRPDRVHTQRATPVRILVEAREFP
jgi:hypothetical protein